MWSIGPNESTKSKLVETTDISQIAMTIFYHSHCLDCFYHKRVGSLFFRKSARAIMPALVKAQHSDKTSVVDLLKDISIKCNRMYTDFALFTLPVRKPKISPELLTRLGLSRNDEMDCDDGDDKEDPDYLVSSC